MLTITEALQEIKTIGKRLEKKRTAIGQYVARDARVKDPLEREGGSVEYIKQERQAIADLEKRIVAIRTAIQKKNLEATLSLHDQTQTIAEWLTWRREVSPSCQAFLSQLTNGVNGIRSKAQKEGARIIGPDQEQNAKPGEIVVHLDEKALLEEQEKLVTLLGDLDGKLSLLNATTTIDV